MRLTDRYREELASPTGPLIERRAGDRDDHGPNVVYIYGGSLRGRVLLPYGDADNCLRCANVQLDAPDSAMRRGNFTVPNVHSAFKSNFSRSEEHTSELQSLMRISYAVFCLKKKQTLY